MTVVSVWTDFRTMTDQVNNALFLNNYAALVMIRTCRKTSTPLRSSIRGRLDPRLSMMIQNSSRVTFLATMSAPSSSSTDSSKQKSTCLSRRRLISAWMGLVAVVPVGDWSNGQLSWSIADTRFGDGSARLLGGDGIFLQKMFGMSHHLLVRARKLKTYDV
jgi:hypothetical protein